MVLTPGLDRGRGSGAFGGVVCRGRSHGDGVAAAEQKRPSRRRRQTAAEAGKRSSVGYKETAAEVKEDNEEEKIE